MTNATGDKSSKANSKSSPLKRRSERGNIFFALFGAVAIVGVLGAGIMSTMRGPLSTMVNVNNKARAEAEMSIASKLILLESMNDGSDGDCDTDGFIEPLPYDANIAALVGGGTLPANVGTNRQDPWGTSYGYCGWDAGGTSGQCAGLRPELLNGDGAALTNYSIIAVISAGPDRVFQASCADHPGMVTKGGDDIVVEHDYQGAAAATDGLWNIKSGDATTAEISKNIEVTGKADFTDLSTFGAGVDLSQTASSRLTLGAASMLFPTQATLLNTDCDGDDAANIGLLRVNDVTVPDTLEICDSATNTWVSVASGAAAISIWAAGVGDKIYYNTGTPEVGIGTITPTSTLHVVGSTTLDGTQNTTGAVDFDSTLNVDGNTTLIGTLDVTGDTTVDVLNATGAVDFDSTLNVDGNTTLIGTLDVTGDTTVDVLNATGAVDFDSTLNVDGNSTLSDTLITGSTSGVTTVDALTVEDNLGADILVVQNDGNVGIGKTDPTVELDVVGSINTTVDIDAGGDIDAAGNVEGTIVNATQDLTAAGDVIVQSEVKIGSDVLGPPEQCNSATEKLLWTNGGGASAWSCVADVGAGGTTGGNTLEEVLTAGDDANGQDAQDLNRVGSDKYCNAGLSSCSGLNSVGLGLTTTASGDSSIALGQEVNVTATGDNSMAIGLGDATGVAPQVSGAGSLGIFMGDQSGEDLTTTNVMAIMGGNVGIGTVAPSVNLEVEGGAGTTKVNIIETNAVLADRVLLNLTNNGGSRISMADTDNAVTWLINNPNSTGGGGFGVSKFGSGVQEFFITNSGDAGIGDHTPNSGTGGQLKLDVEGPIGGTKYCDEDGNNCFDYTDIGGGTPALSSIIAATATNTIANANYAQVWNWDTLSTQTAMALGSTSITSGKVLDINSSATAFTGTMADVVLSGNNAANTGTLVKSSVTGALSTATPLMVTNLGAGESFRVNDETGDADASPFVIDDAGNVGIGKLPTVELDVLGDTKLAGNIEQTTGNLSFIPTATFEIFDNGFGSLFEADAVNGRIGINDTTPDATFDVAGTIQFDNFTTCTALETDASGFLVCGTDDAGGTGLQDADGDTKIQVEETADEDKIRFDTLGVERMIIDDAGLVGIGDSTPDHKLDVAGNIGLDASSYINFGDTDGTTGYGVRDNAGAIECKDSGGAWAACVGGGTPALSSIIAATATNTIANANYAQVWNWDTLSTQTAMALGSTSITSGKVLDINSSATAFTGTMADVVLSGNNAANTGTLVKSSVTGALSTATPLMVTNLGAGESFRVNDETGDADATPFIIDDAGLVGIGTTGPEGQLHVANTGTVKSYIESTDNGPVQLRLRSDSTNRRLIALGADDVTESQVILGDNGAFVFAGPVTPADIRMVILSTGDVGIGDTTPDSGTGGQLMLDVEGPIGGTKYCDEDGNNCFDYNDVGGGGGSSDIFEISGGVVSSIDANVPYTSADFVFGSPQLADDTIVAHDARMFFDKSKGSFRSGSVLGAQWDDASVGSRSTAMGYNTTASNDYSIAMGDSTTASGESSIAMGAGTTASQYGSVAMGESTTASGYTSVAMGESTIASGHNSLAMGVTTIASGDSSFAMGSGITASANYSVAIGQDNTAAGLNSIALGQEAKVTATGANSMAIGLGNASTATEPQVSGAGSLGIFMGDQQGVDVSAANTMAVMGGSLGIGTVAPAGELHIANTGTVTSYVESTDNGAVQLRLKSNSTNRRLVALGADDVTESQIILGDNGGFSFAGPSTLTDTRMTILASGDVGIGDTTPDSGTGGQLMLDVEGPIGGTKFCDENGDDCFVATDVGGGGSADSLVDADGDTKIQVEETADEDKIRFDTLGVERMIIDDAGLVGIGTTTPTSKLEIATADDTTGLEVNSLTAGAGGSAYMNFHSRARFGYDGTRGVAITDENENGTTTSKSIVFDTAGSERMRINTAGLVGIGTDTPLQTLHIKKTGDASIFLEADSDNVTETDNPFIKFSQDGAGVQSILGIVGATGFDPENVAYTGTIANSALFGTTTAGSNLQLGTNDIVRMTINSAGSVGIGDTSPSFALDVLAANALGDVVGDITEIAEFSDTLATGANKNRLSIGSVRGTNLTTSWYNTGMRIKRSVDNTDMAWIDLLSGTSTSNNIIRFGEGAGTEWMRIVDGNVGIGDTTPNNGFGGQLKLDVEGNVGAIEYCDENGNSCYTTAELLAGGLWTDNTTHVTRENFHVLDAGLAAGSTTAGLDGNGTYAFFDPDKGAFRGGTIGGGNAAWQDANVGANSFAFGVNTQAKGSGSTAIGQSTTASGNYSTAMGQNTTAAGTHSLAIGESTNTTGGDHSFVGGWGSVAGGDRALSYGFFTSASGARSVALGDQATAGGTGSFAVGTTANASGQGAIAIGYSAAATNVNSTAIGDSASANGALNSMALGTDVNVSGNYAVGLGLGRAAGADPIVSGANSFGIFMGDQTGVNLTTASTMAIMGGNVGIGTVTPGETLEVAGNINATGTRIEGDGKEMLRYSDAYLRLNQSGAFTSGVYTPGVIRADGGFSIDAQTVLSNDGQRHYFGNASQHFWGDQSATLSYYGNHSTATSLRMNDKEGTGYGQLYGSGNGSTFGLLDGDGDWSYQASKDSYTAFRINNSEKMRITTAGFVGIGDTTPSVELDVNGVVRAQNLQAYASGVEGGQIEISNNAGAAKWYIDDVASGLRFRQTGFPSQFFMQSGSNNIGIANVSPNVELDVIGSIEYTGTIADVSDRRLKDNITPLDERGSMLDRLDDIETYSFTMKGDEDKRVEFGVMAQELEEIFPELVNTAPDEMGTKSVNYVGLIAPMIEATKELKAQNATLKAELNDLSKQVELLNKLAVNDIDKASMESWLLILLGMLGSAGFMILFTRKTNTVQK